MTREEYIAYLKANQTGNIMHMFFVESTGLYIPAQLFSKLLSDYLSSVAIRFLLDGNSLLEVCENRAIQYFDSKYNTVYAIREEEVINMF